MQIGAVDRGMGLDPKKPHLGATSSAVWMERRFF
jgi:hypothetical protein